jgi:hypothetical protein
VNTHVRHRASAVAVSVISVSSFAFDKALFLHFGRSQNLAAIVKEIVAPFLSSPDVLFVRRMIKKTKSRNSIKDYSNAGINTVNVADVEEMAIHRGKVQRKKDGSTLQTLVKNCLGYHLPKAHNIRSDYELKADLELPDREQQYSALNAVSGLQVFHSLLPLPEFCTRVLGDAFHLMNRFDLPLHHVQPAFFRALRAVHHDRPAFFRSYAQISHSRSRSAIASEMIDTLERSLCTQSLSTVDFPSLDEA